MKTEKKILICVLNHHTRSFAHIEERLKEIGYDYKIFTDNTNLVNFRETRWLGLQLNYLNVLGHKTDADWKVIMHDDIDFDTDLFNKIKHILSFAPSNLISFYNPTNRGYLDCAETEHRILKTYSNWWSQCHAFPKELEEQYLQDCKENDANVKKYAEDGLLQRYFSKYEIPAYAVVPGLIQHIGLDDSVHRLPKKVGKYYRNSATFNLTQDVLQVDWKKEFNEPFLNLIKKSYD